MAIFWSPYVDDDGGDEPVNTEDTSHDTGDQTLEHEVGSEDTDGANTNAGLGSTVGGTEIGENEGGGQAHETKEAILVDGLGIYSTQKQ